LPDSSHLALLLARQIEASGPMSVAEYMRSANDAYYGGADPLGVQGDFITAPEISQMFGELAGLWLADIWLRAGRPPGCHYAELGPGRGTLAADALRAVAQFDFEPDVYFVETSELLRAKQLMAVPHATMLNSAADLPGSGPLLIVANEFFDALPVKQLVATHAGWRELLVARGQAGTFVTVPGTHNMDHIVPAAVRNAPPGSIYETAPETSGILYELTTRILKQGGVLLVIDYGYAEPGLGSTLQAVKDHEFADPFENPGEHDLTAHVNFMEMANLAAMRELRVSGPVTQGSWLKSLGIEQRADHIASVSPARSEEIFAARDRLTDDAQMGGLFKVLAISAPEWPVPEGFAAITG
jgi:NADH dehydrogenase [ubiquinone] 1 alpha subcomplex assembly factor 7